MSFHRLYINSGDYCRYYGTKQTTSSHSSQHSPSTCFRRTANNDKTILINYRRSGTAACGKPHSLPSVLGFRRDLRLASKLTHQIHHPRVLRRHSSRFKFQPSATNFQQKSFISRISRYRRYLTEELSL
jgi:hypothetical protein